MNTQHSSIIKTLFTLGGLIGIVLIIVLIIGFGAREDADILMKTHTVTLHTNTGDITLEMYGTAAPQTVENFINLAEDGFYDGVQFHRIIPGFMIQSGDPKSKEESLRMEWGTGGPGYQFEDEIHDRNNNNVGTIAMANAGPNTNGSQFFINVADNNFLDDKHTVFGKVIDGMDTVMAITEVDTLPNDQPIDAVMIENITVTAVENE